MAMKILCLKIWWFKYYVLYCIKTNHMAKLLIILGIFGISCYLWALVLELKEYNSNS